MSNTQTYDTDGNDDNVAYDAAHAGFEDDRTDTDAVSDDVRAAREQVEQTRAEMSDTIDAIKEKLSPHHMVEEAKEATVGKAKAVLSDAVDSAKDVFDSAKEVASNVAASAKSALGDATDAAKAAVSHLAGNASHTAHNAVDSVKEASYNAGNKVKGAGDIIVETIKLNPIPAAITGVGLAWLLMSAYRQKEASSMNYNGTPGDRFASTTDEFGMQNNFATSNTYSGPSTMDTMKSSLSDAKDKVAQKAGDIAHSVSDTASNVAQTVSNKASDVAHTVSNKASDVAHTVSNTASEWGGQVKGQAQRAASATGDFYQVNPLAMGAIALLVGAAVGLMIPATDPENRLMGETRDRLKDQAAQQFQDVAGKVSAVAQTAFDSAKQTVQETVKQEAQNQGLTPVAA